MSEINLQQPAADVRYTRGRMAIAVCIGRHARGYGGFDAEMMANCYHLDEIDGSVERQ